MKLFLVTLAIMATIHLSTAGLDKDSNACELNEMFQDAMQKAREMNCVSKLEGEEKLFDPDVSK